MKRIALFSLFLFFILIFSGAILSVQAQSVGGQSLAEQRAQLEQQLREIEAQIAQDQKELTKVQSQRNTLANKIKQLKIQQSSLTLKIKALSLQIDQSVVKLTQVQFEIDQNKAQIVQTQDRLAAVISQLWREKQSSLFDLFLSAETFSDFYNGLYNLQRVGRDLAKISRTLKKQEADLEIKQEELAAEEEAQRNFFALINLQNSALAQNIQDQNNLLKQTKGRESNYQNLIKQNQQQAAAIKGRIYSLIGVSKQINFGEAVEIAKWASGQTGVRPAFLLAILTQESNLGRNVGTCNRAGDPPSKSWKVIMKPSRDQVPFQTITKELGMNIDTTPVSCPMRDKNGNRVGWGGAMGPAQFIPSTWMGYRAKISAITGKAANPWDIRDAFLAAAIKLRADGGANQSGEWAAAMRYFSGSTNSAYSFYGDNVVATAAKYQRDIENMK